MSAIQLNATVELNALAYAIAAVGDKQTILVEGDMGSGKTSILKLLARLLPKHVPVYFDSTTKDIADMFVPMFDKIDDDGVVRYAVNEELGFHSKKPIILMIDELGKANPSVKNGLLRIMQEHETAGGKKLPDGSIVFATTNLGAEQVGDLLPPHARNRITVVRMRKPDHKEWVEWGQSNGIHHSVLGWVNENPQVLQSFTELPEPSGNPSTEEYQRHLDDANPYIYHPKAKWRTAFVTPRSLEAASDILWQADKFDKATVRLLLTGTIGDRAARDMQSFLELASDLPTNQDIKDNPMTAKVPESPAAYCMVVQRTLATIEYQWVSQWMKYLSRLPKEAQGLFINAARKDDYHKQDVVVNTKEFQEWCVANGYMYFNDKK
jgi:energy-coupling factor transporter ATP-binding protein EcfA2